MLNVPILLERAMLEDSTLSKAVSSLIVWNYVCAESVLFNLHVVLIESMDVIAHHTPC